MNNTEREDVQTFVTFACDAAPPSNYNVQCVIKADGFRAVDLRVSGLRYDKEWEAEKLKECMDTWQKSSRCCPSSCSGGRCGLVVLNRKNSGHCRNVLFERCDQCGGNGHENLIKTFTNGGLLNCELIYGYSIKRGKLDLKGGRLDLKSGTLNGNDMPDVMKDILPKVFDATREGGMATLKIPCT